ncbi:hypothetical protein KEM09_11375 [Carboxylicivirga mesophila]|uniref:Uncharacterized protein n=1 Tax=Carboxylicivirga mesophila TaxID=1166478 RepID=A0ABS5KAH5_9BACT|nr:hypothetical protein [Carboxylicivirga mesophila]MBS2212010.1 hypothetical protein [Carboxylicivirga mesophila]
MTTQQEAWLYRIVQKTPALSNSWKEHFTFNTEPFQRVQQGELKSDFDAIFNYQQQFPESLQINYQAIKTSSHGLITEAAIKLTLWELNEELKACIYHPDNRNHALWVQFSKPLIALLPKIKSKKQEEAIKTVMHPSLPIFKKIETLEALKLDAMEQKEVLNRWSQMVADYCQVRSQYFFSILSDGAHMVNTAFLAAGEGSGTAGLLYEEEINPNDSSQLWYGKGIGLFTYQLRTYQKSVRLKEHLSTTMQLPAGQRVALHTSLWGLNSSFKPMLIITDDTISYHLFANFDTKTLSPDAHLGEGISHFDRIEQYRHKHIIEPLKELQADNSLTTIFNKELASKAAVEDEIHQLEAEIDTLLKYEPDNTNAISYRKRLIDSKLHILSDKEQRIRTLNEKLSKENRDIIQAEEQLKEMVELCGPNPQTWQKQGENYVFPTGVKFDFQTQDLIFPSHPSKRTLQIRLLSASYSLRGKQKDEVQAYVSLTNAAEPPQPLLSELDTTFSYYFHPDEYHSYNTHYLDTILIEQLQHYQAVAIHFTHSDVLKPQSADYHYPDRQREYKLPMTGDALKRQASIKLFEQGDTLHIAVNASTDPVASRLSQSAGTLKKQLSVTKTSTTNNSYLEALRALQTIQTFIIKNGLQQLIPPSSFSYTHPLLTTYECQLIQSEIFSQ